MAQPSLIPLDSIVTDQSGGMWVVGAVTFTGGERYYMLVKGAGRDDVALMPAFVVEQWERM